MHAFHAHSAMWLGVGGLVTLLSYALLLPRVQPGRPVSDLWFGIDGKVRDGYYASMAVAAAGFLAAGSWLVGGTDSPSANTVRARVRLPLTVFFVGSVLWSVALVCWGAAARSHRTWTRDVSVWAVFAALLATTVGAGGLTWVLGTSKPTPVWVSLGAALVLLHVGVLDNVGWFRAYWKATR